MNIDPQRGAGRTRLRRGLAAGAAAALSAGVLVGMPSPAYAAPGCNVTYTVGSSWNGGFVVQALTITNTGDPISGGWTLTWTYGNSQRITSSWNSAFTQDSGSSSVTGFSASTRRTTVRAFATPRSACWHSSSVKASWRTQACQL